MKSPEVSFSLSRNVVKFVPLRADIPNLFDDFWYTEQEILQFFINTKTFYSDEDIQNAEAVVPLPTTTTLLSSFISTLPRLPSICQTKTRKRRPSNQGRKIVEISEKKCIISSQTNNMCLPPIFK